jgi:phosphatidylinositol-3-phosphatase
MKKLLLIPAFALIFSACGTAPSGTVTAASTAGTSTWPAGLPVYDHVVIVVEENQNWDDVMGSPNAPYINSLASQGALFTAMYGEEHHSQGNYFWLFSGSNQNVGFNDTVPNASNNPNYPFQASNLAQQLIAKGLSFKGYSDGLPSIGSQVVSQGNYARKHVPWISFANVPDGTTVDTSSNLRFLDFPSSYDDLPTVSFVIPDLMHDMHSASIQDGDTWLQQNLGAYVTWAQENNSLLIFTFDEDNDTSGYTGLTDPASSDSSMQNRIVTIFVGAHIKPGQYQEGKGITHVNVLRTLEAMYGLGKSGAQQPNAVNAGITDDYIITDVFESVP